MCKLTSECFHQAVCPTGCPGMVMALLDSLAKQVGIVVSVMDHSLVGEAFAIGVRHQGMKS